MTDQVIDPRVVADSVAELGVRPGDMVGMHSRTLALGRVIVGLAKQGREAMTQGVHSVIDGVLRAVGPDGLVMVPTFSYCFAGRPNTPPWNPETTPSQTGWLTEELRLRPDSVRSDNPTHSVACIGRDAHEVTADHEKRTPLGEDSPFHRLAEHGGWICYLGTTGTTLSLLHVAEVVSGVPYVEVFCWAHAGWECAANVEREDGAVEVVSIRQCPGCSKNFGKFDVEAEKEGILRKGKVYDATTVLFRAQDAMDLAVDRIGKEPGFFLCERGTCPACDTRWAAL